MIVKLNAVRSTADISDLIVSRCEQVYFNMPENRGFKIKRNGNCQLYNRSSEAWDDTTVSGLSKQMCESLTEEIFNKMEDLAISLNQESKIAWDSVEEQYDVRTSKFSKTTSDKIASSLLIPEIGKTISI